MKMKLLAVIGFLSFSISLCFAQGNIQDRAVIVKAVVSENPPSIRLEWENSGFTTSTRVYRKNPDTRLFEWANPLANVNAQVTTFTDPNIMVGQVYDYCVVQDNTFTNGGDIRTFSWGGVSAGIKVTLPGYKGDVLIIADTLLQSALPEPIQRFKDDLIEEGWKVSMADKTAVDNVPSIKQKIKNWFQTPHTRGKAVILLGDIPVPYSGNYGIETFPPDGHTPDHNGAWVADVYYGIVDDQWFTDIATNEDGISREENKNRTGDGKFDQSFITGKVDLQIGRIDMSRIPAVSGSYVEKTERYLDKNHAFRNKFFEVPDRFVFEDRNQLLGGEAPGRQHFFHYSTFHRDSATQTNGNYFPTVSEKSFLVSGVTSTAGYTSINGIGGVSNFTNPIYTVFSHYFGSYFVDWDVNNSFLKGAISGPGYTLTSMWSGRPIISMHHMGMGNNIGFSLLHAQESGFQGNLVPFYPGPAARSMHLSMHGDPTLRLHTLHPPSNVQLMAQQNNRQVLISWSPSPEIDVDGYMVYRSTHAEGPYLPVVNAPIVNLSFLDDKPWEGSNYYMVRTVKLKTTSSGTYFNLSQGRRNSIDDIQGLDPLVGVNEPMVYSPDIHIYPNPSTGDLFVSFSQEPTHGIGGIIKDVHGKSVHRFDMKSTLYHDNLSHLTAGVYFIQLYSTDNPFVKTFKWIKR